MYRVKETFEYLVDDSDDFCSVHDALEMDTSMPCPCWEGSKVPVNEKGEEEYIPWGNSTIEVINNAISINKDTLLQLIRDSEKFPGLPEASPIIMHSSLDFTSHCVNKLSNIAVLGFL